MKSALITGAAGGMGLAAAKRLLAEGYTVCGVDIRESEGLEGVAFIRADLTDPEAAKRLRAFIEEKGERLDCIVCMAGIYDLGSLVELDEERIRRIFEVNLFASVRLIRELLPLLREGGRIVLVSSELAPLDPLPFTGIYGITKAAVEKYAFSLRMELQLLGYKVIVLRPGAVDTGLLGVSTRRLEEFVRGTGLYRCNAERFRRIVDGVEARRIPPERVADTLVRALSVRRPRYVYKLNRNPLLLLLNAMPDGLQCRIISAILKR